MHKETTMKTTWIMFLLFFNLVLSGCINSTNAESTPPEIEFQELAGGEYVDSQRTFPEKQLKLITSQASYNEALLIYSDDEPASIDFINGQVLLVDMGLKNTGGYSIKVTSVMEQDGALTANIESKYPGSGCAVTDAETNPFQFVFIPSKKEVLINESRTVTQSN